MKDIFTTHLRTKKYLVLACGILIATLFAAIPHFAFADSGSIGGRPAHPDASNARTASIFIKTITPGETVSDEVEVINNTGEKKTILVYGTDSVPSSGGAFACAQAVDASKTVGSWIKVSETTVEVEANSTKKVSFTISPPANAEPGEQNGCIVLQEQKEASFQSGVALNFRTAIRVAILIPGQINKELSLLGIGVKNHPTKIILNPSVKNTGNVSLDADVTTSIKTVIGTSVFTQTSMYPVLRDQVTEWNFEMDRPFWGGFYYASYDVSYDKNNSFIGSDEPKEMTTLHGQQRVFFVFPHILALLIDALVIGAIVAGVIFYRRYMTRKAAIKKSWVTYEVMAGDTLQGLSKKHHLSWKTLVKANSIKPPYVLTLGKTIKVPGAKQSLVKRSPRKK